MLTWTRSRFGAWLYITPAFILLIAFLVYPVARTLWLSFFGGLGFNPTEFIGLDNYVRLLTNDRLFLKLDELPPAGAMVNSVLWIILFTSGSLGIGMLVAVLANQVRYEPIIKAAIFLPMVISATAASVIFRFVYSPDRTIGVLNAVLTGIFPNLEPIPWLGRISLVNYAVIGAAVWIYTGLAMTVLSAAYKSLDKEVLEAAEVDGANAWQAFWRVSVPMMAQPIAFVAIYLIITALKTVDLVLVMTEGGPRAASRIVGFTIYWEVFNNGLVGYGSAVAIILLILMIPVIIIQIRRVQAEQALR